MILYDPGAIPFAVAIVHRIGEDFSQLRAATDELCSELERLSGQPATAEANQRKGQTWAKGKVSDEMRERANRARPLHFDEHPEWSTQNVADHLDGDPYR